VDRTQLSEAASGRSRIMERRRSRSLADGPGQTVREAAIGLRGQGGWTERLGQDGAQDDLPQQPADHQATLWRPPSAGCRERIGVEVGVANSIAAGATAETLRQPRARCGGQVEVAAFSCHLQLPAAIAAEVGLDRKECLENEKGPCGRVGVRG
jgi:hypothetical protein